MVCPSNGCDILDVTVEWGLGLGLGANKDTLRIDIHRPNKAKCRHVRTPNLSKRSVRKIIVIPKVGSYLFDIPSQFGVWFNSTNIPLFTFGGGKGPVFDEIKQFGDDD